MNITIRQETQNDVPVVFEVVKNAFLAEKISDHQEHFLVARLRESDAFVPELSLVAEIIGVQEPRIIGHILLTKIRINSERESFQSLALAPVSVIPEYQGKGIGGMLIEHAHKVAARLGFESIVLLGHAGYYPRFGYRPASDFDIELPFDVPAENCMVIELIANSLDGVSGLVEYPQEFQ